MQSHGAELSGRVAGYKTTLAVDKDNKTGDTKVSSKEQASVLGAVVEPKQVSYTFGAYGLYCVLGLEITVTVDTDIAGGDGNGDGDKAEENSDVQ